jgi:glutathione peroxidase
MTIRQRILKSMYPLIMKLSRKSDKGTIALKPKTAEAIKPPADLKLTLSNGKEEALNSYLGKKVLLVNTASDCGYTGQFAELQKLSELYGNKLQIIGFPSNDFKEQETADDKAISEFCQVNYGVTFPLAKKSIVLKNNGQNPVFRWLSNPSENGWNSQEPVWNFSKYLLNEQGELIASFGPAIAPEDAEIKKLIES